MEGRQMPGLRQVRGCDKLGDSYSQGGRHWVSRSWPTLRNNLPSGGGKAKPGGLWQECGGSRSGVKPLGVSELRSALDLDGPQGLTRGTPPYLSKEIILE